MVKKLKGTIKKLKAFLGLGERRYSVGIIDKANRLVLGGAQFPLGYYRVGSEKKTPEEALKSAEKYKKTHPKEQVVVLKSFSLVGGIRGIGHFSLARVRSELNRRKQKEFTQKQKLKKPSKYWK